MTPTRAIAEDLRRLGLALMIAGFVGAFLQDKVPIAAAVYGAALGVVLSVVGYWLHNREVDK